MTFKPTEDFQAQRIRCNTLCKMWVQNQCSDKEETFISVESFNFCLKGKIQSMVEKNVS